MGKTRSKSQIIAIALSMAGKTRKSKKKWEKLLSN
jgi:hypothetical protein